MRPRADPVAVCVASGLALRRDLGFYHSAECPTRAYSAYRRRLPVRVLGQLAGWRAARLLPPCSALPPRRGRARPGIGVPNVARAGLMLFERVR